MPDIDYGIGGGCSPGTLWMRASDTNWYQINITGSTPAATINISQLPITYSGSIVCFVDASIGYQLLQADDGVVYAVYLIGSSSSSVSLNVSQSAWSNQYDYKPYLLLKSITDGKFYIAGLHNSSGTISLVVNQATSMSLNL
jgi:hypothetical protein